MRRRRRWDAGFAAVAALCYSGRGDSAAGVALQAAMAPTAASAITAVRGLVPTTVTPAAAILAFLRVFAG